MQPISTLIASIDELVPAAAPDLPPDPRRSFALEVEDAPEALERVLSELRRRRCRILDVAFAAGLVPGEPAHLVVGFEPPAGREHLAERWLTGLHAVHACEAIGG